MPQIPKYQEINIHKACREELLEIFKLRYKDNIRDGTNYITWEKVGWIHVPLNGEQWWTIVNTMMNICVSHKGVNISARRATITSQETL
jgi:hypothetical protein